MGLRLAAVALLLSAVATLTSCGDDPNDLTGRPALRKGRSTSGGASGTGTEPGEVEGSEQQLVGTGATTHELCWSTINEYRKKAGVRPYDRLTEQEKCADGEAQSDAQTNRAHGAFPRCGELAQNECPGTPGQAEQALPRCLAAMMAEGPGGGHHDTMLSTKYTKAFCGVHMTTRGLWSVQNFR